MWPRGFAFDSFDDPLNFVLLRRLNRKAAGFQRVTTNSQTLLFLAWSASSPHSVGFVTQKTDSTELGCWVDETNCCDVCKDML